MAGEGQTIFLLEIFVDNVQLRNCAAGKESMKTCVRLKLLDYPMLEIMESEFCGVPGESCNFKYDLGKSCLFSMKKQPLGRRKTNPMNLDVNVVQMTSPSNSKTLGRTTVNMRGSFTSLLQSTAQGGDKAGPASQVVKDTYQLTDEGGKAVGEINLFVRLSSFGDIIVTQFQMSGLESNSFLFKEVSDIKGKQFEGSGGDVRNASERLLKQQSSHYDKITQGASEMSSVGGQKPPHPPSCFQTGFPPPMGFSPPGYPPPMPYPQGHPFMNSQGMPGMPGMPGDPFAGYNGPPLAVMGPPMPPGLVPPPSLPDYKDIKATINGHVLNIKVLRKEKKLKPPEVVFCQKLRADDDDSASEDSGNRKKRSKTCPKPCCPPPTCGSPCCPSSDPPITLCKCDIPAPPCCATVSLPPCPPPDCKPEKKKKKKKYGGDGQFTFGSSPQQLSRPFGSSPQGFGGFPMPQPAPQSSLDQRNFLISMEPRQDWPSAYSTPPHQLKNCITVRGTQYEAGDMGKGGGEKAGKGGKKGKGDKKSKASKKSKGGKKSAGGKKGGKKGKK